MNQAENYYIIMNYIENNKNDDGEKYLVTSMQGESALTESTFMGRAGEVHLQSWHRDHEKGLDQGAFPFRVKMHRQMPLSE